MLSDVVCATTLPVKDLEAAKIWYKEKLGLSPVDERPSGVLFETGGGTSFYIYPSGFAGTNQATAMVWLVDDVEKTVSELRDKGVEFEEYDLPGLKTVNGVGEIDGELGAWFKDPDGNILSIFRKIKG